MKDDKTKIERIKEMVKNNQERKVTTSMIAINCSGIVDENEVRDLVEKSDSLVKDSDIIKVED